MFLIILQQGVPTTPNITDWLQGVGAIIASIGAIAAIIGAVAAFIALFKKDKQKQEQINKIIEISNELKSQTQHFSAQTDLMQEANMLLKEQIQIQNDVLLDDKEYKQKMSEFREKEQKAKFKPNIRFLHGSQTPYEIDIVVQNFGETATIRNIKCVDDDNLTILTPVNFAVHKNGTFNVKARNGKGDLHLVGRLIDIMYEDSLGNKYAQTLNVGGGKTQMLEPRSIQ